MLAHSKPSVKYLPNNVTYAIIHVPSSEVVDIRIAFDLGFRNFTPEAYHAPHIVEHMLMEFQIDGKTMSQRLQPLGVDINASTDVEALTFIATAPAEHVVAVLEVVVKYATTFRVDEAKIGRETEVVRRELEESLDGLAAHISYDTYAMLASEFAPARVDEVFASLASLQSSAVIEAGTQFATCGVRAVIVGAVPATVGKKIGAVLSSLQPRVAFSDMKLTKINQTMMVDTVPNDENYLGVVNVNLLENKQSDTVQEMERTLCVDSFIHALYFRDPSAGTFGKLRDEGVVYSLQVDQDRICGYTLFSYFSMIQATSARTVVLAVFDTLFQAMELSDDDTNFADTKSYIINSFAAEFQTTDELANKYLADFLWHGQPIHVEELRKTYQHITPEDVRMRAYKKLTTSQWRIVLPDDPDEREFTHALRELQQALHETDSIKAAKKVYAKWQADIADLPVAIKEEDTRPVVRTLVPLLLGFTALTAGLVAVEGYKMKPVTLYELALQYPIGGWLWLIGGLLLCYMPRTTFLVKWRAVVALMGAVILLTGSIMISTIETEEVSLGLWSDVVGGMQFIALGILPVVVLIRSIQALRLKAKV